MYKTLEQITQEYQNNWIYMINCQENEYFAVVGGEVVSHSPDREKVLSVIEEYTHETSLTLLRYIGSVPSNIGVIR